MTLTEAVKGTYAVIGQSMTDTELAMIVADLSAYPPDGVLSALARCRRELKRITLAEIIDRIPGGHPGSVEAWALVSKCMQDEAVSIVWTDEMREAAGVAMAVHDDLVAARMAFKEAYTRIVSEARTQRKAPRWSASLGWDPHGRAGAQREAENRNRLAQGLPALPLHDLALLSDPGVEDVAQALVKPMSTPARVEE